MAEPIESLKNLGPQSGAWLREAGIATRDDLEQVGAVFAFQRVCEMRPTCSLNLLYALHGALTGLAWNEIPPPVKRELRSDVGR